MKKIIVFKFDVLVNDLKLKLLSFKHSPTGWDRFVSYMVVL